MAVSNKVLAIMVGIMTLIMIPLLVLTIITFVDVKNNPKGAGAPTEAPPTGGTTISSGTAGTGSSGTPPTGSSTKGTSGTGTAATGSTGTGSTGKSTSGPTTKTTKTSTSTTKTTPSTSRAPPIKKPSCLETRTCVNSANMLLAGMNQNVDPCQDFYQYVCGHWLETHPLTNGESAVSSFGNVQDGINELIASNLSQVDLTSKSIAESIRTAAFIYQSCQMSGQQYPDPKQILNIIDSSNPEINFQTNGWPMITANWTGPTDKFNLGTLIADLDTLFLLPTLLHSSVTVDGKNVAQNMLYIGQATLALNSREYYIDPLFNDVLLDYRDLITNVSYIMCKNQTGGCSFTKEQLQKSAQDIVDFEVSIARKTIPATELRNYTSQFNNFTMSEISLRFASRQAAFNWVDYFQHLLGHHFDTFPSTDYIVIAQPGFVDQLLGDFNSYSDAETETVINYLIWRFVFDNLAFVTSNPGDAYSRLKSKVKGLKDLPPTPTDCANVIVNYMPYVAGYIYVWNAVPDTSVLVMDATDMINNVLSSFSNMLSQLNWYDAKSLAGAQKKITNMQRNVAYPPQTLYTSYLDSYYSTFLDIPTKAELQRYLDVLLYVKNDVQELMFQQLSTPGDRTNFLMSPALVNAWYQPQLNSITFPAAIFNPPYYQIGNPKVLNYGALGHVMGHELSHAFDDEGTQFNQDGTLSTWMTPNTQSSFQTQADCIQSEYNQFCYPQQYDYVCVNGINTQGENIADNGGIVAAYNAYKTYESLHGKDPTIPGLEQFTSDQLFFISNTHLWCSAYSPSAIVSQVLTDVHSPAYYRIFGTYRNFDAFGQAFNCTRGDRYYPYPEEQCPLYQPSTMVPKAKSNSKSNKQKLVKSSVESKSKPIPADTCTTQGCQDAANLIINAMNSSADPCDDFYAFSCGNWIQNTPFAPGVSLTTAAYQQQMAIMANVTNYLENTVVIGNVAFSTAVQTAKVIYDSCMSSTGNSVNELLAVVNDLTLQSGWPIIQTTWAKPTGLTAETLIGQLDAFFGIPTLLTSVVDADLMNPSVYSLGIDQASLALGYRQYYIDPRYTQNLQDYTQLVIDVAKQLAADTGSKVQPYTIMKDAQTIVNIEVELARKTIPRDDRRNYAITYHPYDLTALQARWPFFNWVDYLDMLLYKSENPDQINSFVIMNTGYMDELHGDWNYQLQKRDYFNYLIWRYIYNNLMFIGPTYKQIFENFYTKQHGSNALPPPQAFCSNLIIDNMPYVAGDIFLKNSFPSSITQAGSYITDVKNAFNSMLMNLTASGWLDNNSSTNAQQKLSNMMVHIGYSNNINQYSLDQYYSTLTDRILNNPNATNNFFQNWNAMMDFNAKNDFTQIGKQVDKSEFVISSAYVGALYIPKRNVLNVAAGAMNPPFYRQDFPNSVIYGAFGSLVGHEILQGFNDLGVQLNKNGGLGQLYTEETMDKFSLMAQCLIGQYGQDCYPEQNYLCVDGTNTQGENIADSAGLIAAYNAYENFLNKNGPEPSLPGLDTYSNEQIFFMSYGQSMCEKATGMALRSQLELDPHPPNRDRVNGVVKNFDKFSQAFQCKSDDPMSLPADQQCYVYTTPYEPPPPTTPTPRISNTTGWQAAADNLEAYVNTTLDPCEDFYAFVCEDWIKANPLDKGEAVKTPITEIQKTVYRQISSTLDNIYSNEMSNNSIPASVQTAAQAYHACQTSSSATYANLSFIVNALTDALGAWPMITPGYVSPSSGKTSIFGDIGTLEAAYLLPTLFNSKTDVDWTNVQRPALYIDEATLVLERDYYINPLYHGYLDAYESLIFETSYQICNSTKCRVSNDTMKMYARDIIEFETNIARKKIPINERRNAQSNFNEFNISMLTHRWIGIDWDDYLTGLLKTLNVNVSAVNVDFVIMSPGYVDQLDGDVLVDEYFQNLTTITNYLGWRLIYQNMIFFPNQPTPLPPSPEACVAVVDAYMPFAIGNVYVNSMLSNVNSANQQADFLTQIISNSFTGLFTELLWQDDQTKANAVQKVGYMVQNFGYPDWILDKNQLDNLYKQDIQQILAKEISDFWSILNILRYSRAQMNFMQLTQKQPMSRYTWPISPAQAAAVYEPQRNAFTVGAALFNQPFFDSSYPQAVNYGSLGTILGHELVHAFDDVGVQFSSNGTLNMWMSPLSYFNYAIMADCVVNKYNTYCYPEVGIDMCINGVSTQGENIADIGGLEASYRAYQSYVAAYGEEPRLPGAMDVYTMEQVFFMSYARGMCSNIDFATLVEQVQGGEVTPAKYRINGAFKNFYKFGEAFKCQVGSPMFPPTVDVCPVFEVPPYPPYTTQATSSTSTTTLTPPPKADNSTGYKEAADDLIAKMNQSVNPCSDFYHFACGQWIRKNQPTEQQNVIDVYSQQQSLINQIIAQNLKTVNINDQTQPSSIRTAASIYQSCKRDHSNDGEKILDAIDMFPNVNGWPIITHNWADNGSFDPFEITGLLDSEFLIPTLLESAVAIDWKDHKKNKLYIQQGSLALGDREFYMNPYFTDVVAEYKQLIINTATYLNTLNGNLSIQSQIMRDAQSIVDFETNLARTMKTQFEQRNFTALYNEFTLNQLPNRYRNIGREPWMNYLNALLEGSTVIWTLDTTAIVTQPGYIDELDGDIATYNARDYANYLMWRFVFAHLQFLPDSQTQYSKFYKAWKSVTMTPSDSECVNVVNAIMPYVTGYIYMNQDVLLNEALPLAETVLDYIKNQTMIYVDLLPIDNTTKEDLFNKLSNVVVQLGYPQLDMDINQLNNYYSYLNGIIGLTDYWAVLHFAQYYTSQNNFKRYQSQPNLDEFASSPAVLLNDYIYPKNLVTVPLVSLEPPFGRSDYPFAVNFGGIGVSIARQFAHIFDDIGIQFDQTGVLNADWIPDYVRHAFDRVTQCVVTEYGQHCYNQPIGLCVNGLNTMEENQADIFASGFSYMGYKMYVDEMLNGTAEGRLPGLEKYTPEQIYFISYAQQFCENATPQGLQRQLLMSTYSPGQERVNGALRNVFQFGRSFNCKRGDYMYPPQDQMCLAN